MKRLVMLVLLFALPPLAHADAAACPLYFQGSTALESGDRAYAILATLQLKVGIPVTPIQLCVWENNVKNVSYVATHLGNIGIIGISRVALINFSDAALRGALAHELGHIVEQTHDEEEADAFAVELVGAKTLRITYMEYTHNKGLAQRRTARALQRAKGLPSQRPVSVNHRNRSFLSLQFVRPITPQS